MFSAHLKKSRPMVAIMLGGALIPLSIGLAPGASAGPHQEWHGTPTIGASSHASKHQLAAPSGTQCFSNIRSATGSSYVSQNFESAFDQYDATAADDFQTSIDCTVTEIQVPGIYFQGAGPADSETVTFYADGGGSPGAVLNTQTVVGDDQAGSFDIALSPVSLSAHTQYWVSVQANMDVETGGEWGWDADSTQAENPAVWENPGDGFATGCTTWGTLQTCLDADGPDLQFALSGDISGTSDHFAGYLAPVSAKAGKSTWTLTGEIFPANDCRGKKNGYQYTYEVDSEMTTSDSGVYVLVTVTCHDGVPTSTSKICYWAWTTDSCRPIHIPLGDGASFAATMAAKGSVVKGTIENLDTGEVEAAQVKVSFNPQIFSFGMTNFNPKQRSFRIDPMATQSFRNVTLNGLPLEQYDPRQVTMRQKGRAILDPTGIEGGSFDIEYVG